MKITNKYNLPDPIVNSARERTPPPVGKLDTIRVTRLISAPKPDYIIKAHWNDIESDASDNIWALFGKGIHAAIEASVKGKVEGKTYESEYFMVRHEGLVKITGTADLIETDLDGTITIYDFKTTTAWAVFQEKPDWEKQLNVYAWLHNTDLIRKLKIVAIIRDWNRNEAAKDKAYPQAPMVVLDIPVWTNEMRQMFVEECITDHANAAMAWAMGDELPDCTPEQRWFREGVYALQTEAGKSIKNEKTLAAMHEYIARTKKDMSKLKIFKRADRSVRCQSFCNASPWCKQYQERIKPTEGIEGEII